MCKECERLRRQLDDATEAVLFWFSKTKRLEESIRDAAKRAKRFLEENEKPEPKETVQ